MAGLPWQLPPGLILLFPLFLLPLLTADPYPFEWHSSDFSCSGLLGGKWESAASLCVLVSREATAWKDASGVCRNYSFSQPLSDTSWTQLRKIGLRSDGQYWTSLQSKTNDSLMDGAVEMSMYSPAWADREPTTTNPGLCVAIDLSPLVSPSRGWAFVNCSTTLKVVCQTFACLEDEWRCVDNSHCIPSSHRGDGIEDCLDGSDELVSISLSSDISLIHCPLPKNLQNVEVKSVQGYAAGDKIVWQCSRGFLPTNEMTSTCNSSIGWQPSIGCIPLSCSAPYWPNFNLTNPNNGTSHGSRAFFSRSLPFEDPESEYTLIQVCDEGKWAKLNTELTDCFAPPNQSFTRFNASTVSQLELMHFRCPRSLRAETGGDPTCMANGMLSHVPNCTIESPRLCPKKQRTPPFKYMFCTCPPGYVTDAAGTNCTRTDASALGLHTSAVGSTCQDVGDGTYTCTCPKGQCLYPSECKNKGLLAFVRDGQYDPSIGVCAEIRYPPYSPSLSEDFICNATAASADSDSLHSYNGSLPVTRDGDPCNGKCPPDRGTCEYSPVAKAYGCKCKERLPYSPSPFDTATSTSTEYVSPFTWNSESPSFYTSTSSSPTSSIYPSTRDSPSSRKGGWEVDPSLLAPSSISTAFVGEWCEREWTPCMDAQCYNGGTCITDEPGTYICECPIGWTDPASCLTPQSICASHPCENGGSCVDIIPGVFFCSCPPEWTGKHCETLYSSTLPCYNHGEKLSDGSCVCIPPSVWDGSRCTVLQWSIPATECGCASALDTCVYGDTMSCSCRDGYTGQQCEQEEQYCTYSPCLHDGTCIEKPRSGVGYTCVCPKGYTGQACETSMDCNSGQSCQNGGTCLSDGRCNCTLQYTGDYCEVPVKNPCLEGLCKHGGICVPDSLGHPICQCDDVEWTGPTCERRVKGTRNIVLTRTDKPVVLPLPSFSDSSNFSLCGFVRLQPRPATSARPIPIVSIAYPGGEFLRVTSKEVLVGGVSMGALPFIPFQWQHFCIVRFSQDSFSVILNGMNQKISYPKYVPFSTASLTLSPVPKPSEDPFEGTISHMELYRTTFYYYDAQKMYADCGLWSQRPSDDVLVPWTNLVDSSPRETLVSPGFCESTHCPPGGEECRMKDRTPPTAYFCPSTIHVTTADNVHFADASWDEPIFVDDYDIVSVASNYKSGQVFSWGDYHVVYTARDRAGNTGRCSFDVFVSSNNCTMPSDPENGKSVVLKNEDNGVGAMKAIAVQCNDTKFPLLGPSFHTCDYFGQWERVFYTPILTLPQCAWTATPRQEITGAVGFADATECEKKRAEIEATLEKAIAAFCPDGNHDCADIHVSTCAADWWSRAETALSLGFSVKLNSSMENVASSLKNALLHDVSPTVETNQPDFDCTAAFPHKSSKDGETVCAQTAKGTFYNGNAAELCPPDQYQDEYSINICKNCDPGYTTGGRPGCTSVKDCYKSCDPGYACYPRVNRTLCVICARGSYTEVKGKEMCDHCSEVGYTTAGEGSTSKADCNVIACKAGFGEADDYTCHPCKQGTYKTDKDPTCIKCKDGLSTLSEESKSSSDCSVLYCPQNTAINPSSPVTGLDPNTFIINDHCTTCAIDYFQPKPNSTECILCLNNPASAQDPEQCPQHSDECDDENPCGPGKECVLSKVTGHRVCKESSDSSSSPFPWWAGTIIGVAALAALIGLAVMLWIYREKLSCCSYWKKPEPPSPEDFNHTSSAPMSSVIVPDVDYEGGDSEPKGGNYLNPSPYYPDLLVDVHQRDDYGRSGQAFRLAPAPSNFPAKAAEVLPHELVEQHAGNPSVLPPSAHSLRSAVVASEVPGTSYGDRYALPSPPPSTFGSTETSRDNTPRNTFRYGRSTRLNEGYREDISRRKSTPLQRSRCEGGYNFPDDEDMHH